MHSNMAVLYSTYIVLFPGVAMQPGLCVVPEGVHALLQAPDPKSFHPGAGIARAGSQG